MRRLLQMPSDQDRLAVRERVMAGATEDDISAYLDIPVKRVKKLFRREFEEGAAEAKHAVLWNLFEAARSGANTTASIFCAKARFGWRDTGARESGVAATWPPFILEIAS